MKRWLLALLALCGVASAAVVINSYRFAAVGATFTDTFIRADADPMSTTASGGGTWTSGPGTFQDCKILSNELRGAGALGTENGARVLTPSFSGDHSATVLSATPHTSVGPMTRVQGTGDASGYVGLVVDATHVEIYKVTDTGTIAYALLANFIVADSSLEMTLASIGTTHELFLNGVSAGSVVDATWSGGQPGIYLYGFGPIAGLYSATDE